MDFTCNDHYDTAAAADTVSVELYAGTGCGQGLDIWEILRPILGTL